MNCETIDDLLLDLLYEEVEGDTKIQAEAHLSTCEGCQQKLAAMGGVRRSFQAMPEPEMPQLGYQALLAEATAAAKQFTQPQTVKREEGLWSKLSAAMRVLLSPPVAIAAGLVLVLTVSLSINEKAAPEAAKSFEQAQMAPAPASIELPPAPKTVIAPNDAPEAIAAEPSPAETDAQEELKIVPAKLTKAATALPKDAGDKTAEKSKGKSFDDLGDGFGGEGVTATPGVASGEQFSNQSIALARDGKCTDAEKTARAISAGSADWCQGMKASAQCFQQNKQFTETRNLYTEMQSFNNCAAEAEKALASLNQSQTSGPKQGAKSTIRDDFKKKAAPSPAPKTTDTDNTLSPFKQESKNVSQ